MDNLSSVSQLKHSQPCSVPTSKVVNQQQELRLNTYVDTIQRFPQNFNQTKVCQFACWVYGVYLCEQDVQTHTRVCVYLRPYRLHLFGDGGELLNFGPQFISLPVHHFLQPQHHLPLLPLDAVCTQTHTHTHEDGWISTIFLKNKWTEVFPQR